jgi:hypothetical protein
MQIEQAGMRSRTVIVGRYEGALNWGSANDLTGVGATGLEPVTPSVSSHQNLTPISTQKPRIFLGF